MAAKLFRLALLFLILGVPAFADDRPRDIANALALQEAIRNGRELVIKGEHAKAVDVLEKQLDRSNADPTYLALLREAYAGYVKELELAGKAETLEIYRRRLAVLDRKPAKTPVAETKADVKVEPKSEPSQELKLEQKPLVKVTSIPQVMPRSIVRGTAPEEDPFQQVSLVDREMRTQLLARADEAFGVKRFDEARDLFARATKVDPELNPAQQSQFAYCLINGAVAMMNSPNPPPHTAIENEVRTALASVPKDSELDRFGQKLLNDLASKGTSGIPVTGGPIRHTPAADGWAKAESTNFRLFHNQPPEAAEQIVRIAEQHRAAAFAKWATTNPPAWQPICELYLYANGADYAQATGQPATSPGHSTIKAQNGKVNARRMDLRVDDVNFLGSVLPHETTHVVLGDLFADRPLPRWADEGMAVLSEPRSQVDRYTKTLVRCREKSQLLPLATILSKPDYPDAAAVTVFYVESVSVVEYMMNLKGPAAFVNFMHDSNRGFDAALQQHYGIKSVADLQDRWLRATFTEIDRERLANR